MSISRAIRPGYWLARILLPLAFLACQEAPTEPDSGAASDPVCTPACDGRACGPDGCGGVCGECAGDAVCTTAGQCGNAPADCSKSCAELELSCGDHCGEACGECTEPNHSCEDGACMCTPQCSAATCEQPDGCGSQCGLCPTVTPCELCALTLQIMERTVEHRAGVDVVTGVVVGLSYQGAQTAERPVLADVRLLVSGPATLKRVGVGQPLLDANKALRHDSLTGRPFVQLEAGVIQTIVYSPKTAHPIGDGEWLYWDFQVGEPNGPIPTAPVEFSLVPRENILAPGSADQSLWGSEIDTNLVVWAR